MCLDNLEIRNFDKRNDIQNYVKYYNPAHTDFPEHRDLTSEIAQKYIFGVPEYDEKSHYLAMMNSEIIGDVKGDVYAGTGVIRLLIKPEYRFKGIESKLMAKIEDYFTSLDVSKFRMFIPAQFDELVHVISTMKYHHWKSGYAMKCDLIKYEPAKPNPPSGYQIETTIFDKEKNDIVRVLANGFSETTDGETEGMIDNFNKVSKESYFNSSGIFVAKNDNEIVGTSINLTHPALPTTGFVSWLAVLQPDRHKGLGKALLLTGLNWFKETGIRNVELNVDLDNPDAVGLYKNCGFEVISENKILQKSVPSG